MSGRKVRLERAPAPACVGALVVFAAALAAPAAARAGDLGGRVELGAAIGHLDYAEYGDRDLVLDRERGGLPALVLAGELSGAPGLVRATVTASTGTVGYAGRVQSPSAALDGLSATTRSGATRVSAEVLAGPWIGSGRRLAPYAGAAWRSWDRDIAPTSVVSRTGAVVTVGGLREAYGWLELLAGVRYAFAVTPRTEWTLDARLLHTVAPRVSLDSGGRVVLRLGARPGVRVGVEGRVAIAGGWFALGEAHAETFAFGASDPDPRTGVHEPRSETSGVGVGIGVGRRL